MARGNSFMTRFVFDSFVIILEEVGMTCVAFLFSSVFWLFSSLLVLFLLVCLLLVSLVLFEDV